MHRETPAVRWARSTTRLLAETCLSTPRSRLAAAVLLAAGTLPASATDFEVFTAAELANRINNIGDRDSITLGANITLTANLPTVRNSIAINGGNFTLSGNNQYRGVFVESGNVVIRDLTITKTLAQGGTGGSANGGGGGGGGAGLGGALFVANGATVTVGNVTMQDNTAQGGGGGFRNAACNFFACPSGGGGGYWPTGANGGNAGISSGGGGTGGGGDGSDFTGSNGNFGGGGGGGGSGRGGAGGFGGGGGGSHSAVAGNGGFGGGAGGTFGGFGGLADGGGGAGLGGAIFVQGGGSLNLGGSLRITGNAVAGGGCPEGCDPNSGPWAGQGIGSGIFLHGSGSLTVAPGAGQTWTISDAIVDATGAGGTGTDSGSWSLVKNGAGTTILTGANAYTGGTIVNTGVLQGTASGLQGNIRNDASVVFQGGGTYAGNMSGTGSLTKIDLGVLTLTGINSYSGGTIVSGGVLLGNALSLQGNITNNAVVIFDLVDNGTYAGNMSGTGTLIKNHPGVLTLSGTNTYSGGTTVSGGTLLFTADSNLGAAGTGIHLNNGTIGTMGTASNGRPVTITNDGGFFVGSGGELTWSGSIGGSGNLVKSGPGDLILPNANAYTGGTTVNQGTINFGHVNGANIVDALGSGPVALHGGKLRNDTGEIAHFNNNIFLGTGGGTLHDGIIGFTVNGTITGGGSLTIQGTEVSILGVQLAGAATYTGATTIESNGVLRIASPTALAASTSAFRIASGGTFNLNSHDATIGSLADVAGAGGTVSGGLIGATSLTIGSDHSSTSFSGTIEDASSNALGGMSLTKIGTGTQTLSGTNTYTGATTVNGGSLIVNGSIASSSGLTVNAGATVGGTGALPSTTINGGGTLSPGNSIGTITINGNLMFGAGSVYRVEASPSAADRTSVTGSATLAGTVQMLFTPGSGVNISTTYTILSAEGGRSGTFDAVTGLPPSLTGNLSYTTTSALLALKSQVGPLIIGTPNQEAIAAAHDTAFNAGLPAHSALFGLSGAQIPPALDQLSGEVHASTAGVLVDESRYMRGAVLGRLRQASYGGHTGMAPLAFGGPLAFADGEELSALAYAKSPVVKAPLVAPSPTSDVVFWTQGFGAWGRFEGDGNAASVRRDLAGFITGVDTRVGTNGRAGIAAGHIGSRNNLDGRGSANVETGQVAAYGGWSFGAVNLRAGGAYAFHAIDTDRTIAFPGFFDRATARYTGGTGQIFGEFGYGFAFGNVAVEPFAGGAWVRLDTDGAAEHATTAGLNITANSFEVGYSTLGARAASLIPIGGGMVLIPRASAAWQHAFNSVTPAAALAFQLAPAAPFVIAGVPIARDSLLAEVGVDLAIGRNATLGLSYVGQIASNVQDHAAKGKFSWKF